MGAKTCLLAHAAGDARMVLSTLPAPDEAATAGFVASLFPGIRYTAPTEVDLTWTYVRDATVVAGCFPGLRLIATTAVAIDRLSELPAQFISPHGSTIVHAMHSVVDWFAFAVWEDGVLRRALSVAPDDGVIEDIGERLAFEHPFWNGVHPAVDPDEAPDDYPLPFHPLEFGEAALLEFFGFQLEGFIDASPLDPANVRMLRFDAEVAPADIAPPKKPWWKFW